MSNPMESLLTPRLTPPQPRWRFAETWLGFVTGVALYLLASLGMGLVVQQAALKGSPWIVVAVIVPQLCLLLPALLIIRRRGGLRAQLGLDQLDAAGVLLVPVALGVGFCGLMAWGVVLIGLDRQAQEPIIPLFGDSLAGLLAALIAAGLMAPLVEEMLFRGFLFGGLRQRVAPWAAAVLSALLFAALHLQPFAFPVLFLYGILLAMLYHRSNSLWPPILMHATINSLGVLAQFVALRYGLLPT